MPTSTQSSSGSRNRPPGETSEARIAKALAHPLRARILQRLGERVASPGDLALELGALGRRAYHVRMLRDYDCVELVRTEPPRALQHFYRATARPTLDEDQWKTLPSSLRRNCPARRSARSSTTCARRRGRHAGRSRGDRAAHAPRARRPGVQEAQQAARQDAGASAGDRGRVGGASGREEPNVFPTELGVPPLPRAPKQSRKAPRCGALSALTWP